MFKFLDDIIPLEDGEEVEMPVKMKGRKRYVLRVIMHGWDADGDVAIGDRRV